MSPSPSLNHRPTNDSASNLSMSYQEQISNVGNLSSKELDFKTVSKHFVSQEDTLKLQGGDIARQIYHQLENGSDGSVNKMGTSPSSHHGGSGVASPVFLKDYPKRRTRSSSFSTYLSETRRESTASDINVPGGFRREFLINKSLQKNETPPNFLTRNFVEFLSIYGHFAGEDFSDDDGGSDSEETDLESAHGSSYEEVFDEESSLLNEPKEAPKGTASVLKTFFLLFKSLVGSGVLFLPRAFYNGGLSFSIFALTLFGVLTYLCYVVLIKSKKTMNLSSYGELGFKTYGKPLKIFILISIVLSQFGFVATYILFAAENMISFLGSVLPDGASAYLNTANLVLIQFVLLVPLVLIRNLTKLSLVSLVSSVFIIVGLVIIFYYSGVQLLTYGVGPNIQHFNSKNWSMLIGVAVTSFEGIGLILPIEASMAQPEKFPMVLFVGMTVITVLFVGIGTVGYSSFGDEIKSIIILNLPQSKFAVRSILVLYSLAVFLTAPLQLFPAIKILEALAFNPAVKTSKTKSKADSEGKLYRHSGKYNPQVKWLKNLFRSAVVAIICAIAYANASNIDKFVSFNGCFACIPLVYIYPPLIHLRTLKHKPNWTRQDYCLRVFDYVLFVVGIVAVVYTTYQILFKI
ncbi:uncharacterized protein CANTADRAFT_82387 [Suhomyces tanzawaensis NRRL Y-17324]|uniref:Amino acid transporter transmembrane domain-containing protein n=1 Tax=Suhomyces tanzawaensis NRRL Y-17324 TaxID=984487 RepID=A0A1E4SGB3_9ASCO|nr:uncharacterized protein CANTADRAFT_82387 [Suhomyces tanzawaensis NRRL Y-17324]ODV78516.1 hypothetical protein CANTADRAFT_82387 [Suhomyces tanzawaensis NRRL Y-17324]